MIPLPKTAAQMSLDVVKVLVSDIECVTRATIKGRGPMWYLRVKKGSLITKIQYSISWSTYNVIRSTSCC
jgi:hypothetical protein